MLQAWPVSDAFRFGFFGVVNQCANVMRPDFDRLKATLTNCVRLGPDSQNRASHPSFRTHLEGRVAFIESVNPEKTKRLRVLFNQIDWERRL
jgi:RNA-directed DNA polymerase